MLILLAAAAAAAQPAPSPKRLKADVEALVGFGTFEARSRAARQGRNPKTGETITIEASKNAAFKAGKALKDALK